MISKLHITGFQCHRSIELELDPHATMLVGDNGVGKTAVVRALKWWALNIWDGKADQMIHWDMDTAQVLGVVSGHEIIRRKSSKENIYILDGDQTFEAVGAGKVPAAIAAIINMTEENFQEQLDMAFWFHLTAGQVAKSLNKIVNLSDIDASLDAAAAELRQARDEQKSTEQRLQEARKIKESLSWVAAAGQRLTELEGLAASIERNLDAASALASVLVLTTTQTRIRTGAAAAISAGEKAIEAGHEYFRCGNKIKKLKGLIDQAASQERTACDLKTKLVKAQKRLEGMTESLCPECEGTGRRLK